MSSGPTGNLPKKEWFSVQRRRNSTKQGSLLRRHYFSQTSLNGGASKRALSDDQRGSDQIIWKEVVSQICWSQTVKGFKVQSWHLELGQELNWQPVQLLKQQADSQSIKFQKAHKPLHSVLVETYRLFQSRVSFNNLDVAMEWTTLVRSGHSWLTSWRWAKIPLTTADIWASRSSCESVWRTPNLWMCSFSGIATPFKAA